jgi:hypothetical protein
MWDGNWTIQTRQWGQNNYSSRKQIIIQSNYKAHYTCNLFIYRYKHVMFHKVCCAWPDVTILCCYPAVSEGKWHFKTHHTGRDPLECLSVPRTVTGTDDEQFYDQGNTVWTKRIYCASLAIHRKTHTRIRIHVVVCLMTDPQPLTKRVLHIARSSASSFSFQYPLVSLRS